MEKENRKLILLLAKRVMELQKKVEEVKGGNILSDAMEMAPQASMLFGLGKKKKGGNMRLAGNELLAGNEELAGNEMIAGSIFDDLAGVIGLGNKKRGGNMRLAGNELLAGNILDDVDSALGQVGHVVETANGIGELAGMLGGKKPKPKGKAAQKKMQWALVPK